MSIIDKGEGLGDAGESDVGFNDQELVDIGEELIVTDLENVKFIAEDHCIKDSAGGGPE